MTQCVVHPGDEVDGCFGMGLIYIYISPGALYILRGCDISTYPGDKLSDCFGIDRSSVSPGWIDKSLIYIQVALTLHVMTNVGLR